MGVIHKLMTSTIPFIFRFHMTSIHTNVGAMAALQALRTLGSALQTTQNQVSSGLRISAASDNAAYWSISTTMRSDNKAISAVSDALGLGAAKVDVAYAGLESVIDILGDFKAKLVAAKEDGVDKAKIQEELEQLKQQVENIAQSASFNGVNWLNTDVEDLMDVSLSTTSVVSSFVRDASGQVSVKSTEVSLLGLSLFNSAGGGLLQADPRDVKTIGGIRLPYSDSPTGMTTWNHRGSSSASFTFMFSGPLVFDDPTDEITFDVTVDKDNPLDGIPPPYDLGVTTLGVTINRALIDAELGAAANGVISDYKQYARVLNRALRDAGTGAYATTYTDWKGRDIIDRIGIGTSESKGLDGSYIEINNFISTVGSGGLSDKSAFASRGQKMSITFEEFQVRTGVEIRFDFRVNGGATKEYSFDKDYVDTLLGKDNGKVETAAEMVTLLQSLIGTDWPDVIIEETGSGEISIRSDENVDRKSGGGTYIGFSGINVNIEPIPTMNFLDIDITANPSMLDQYLNYMEIVSEKVISSASKLGALQTRIDMQTEFAAKLSDSIESGIGRLVDADMNEASTRLKALQTQEQLAVQSLSIANGNAENIVQLFR